MAVASSGHATGGARAVPEAPVIPGSAPVGAYTAAASTRGGPPRDPLRDAIVEDVRAAAKRAGRPAPIADARLDWAMTDLARHLRGDQLPALEVVDFLLSHYGLCEPSPHFFFARDSAGTDAEIRARAREEFAVALRGGAVGRIGVGSIAAARRCTWWPDFKRRRSSSGRRSPAASAWGARRGWRRASTPPTAIPSW